MIKCADPLLPRPRGKISPILTTSSEFDLRIIYKQTPDSKDFLFKDTIIRGKRELIFANQRQLIMLFESQYVFIQGTFSVSPPFLDYVLTIHGVHHEHGEFLLIILLYEFRNFLLQVVSCVIALLLGRSSTFYNHLLQLLDQQAANLRMTFELDAVTTDFENGLIKSIKHHISFIWLGSIFDLKPF